MKPLRFIAALRNRAGVSAHDLVVVSIAWFGAYWLRFNLGNTPESYLQALETLPVVVIIHGIVFRYLGLHRGLWRFTSLPDLLRIAKAVITGVTVSAVVMFFLFSRLEGVPRSVLPLFAVLLILGLGGSRLMYRSFKDRRFYYPLDPLTKKVIIVGAGNAGEMLVRDMLRDRSYGYSPIAFVDDDPNKRSREIMGVRVVGDIRHIPDLVSRYEPDMILIVMPATPVTQIRGIVDVCKSIGIPMRILPMMRDVVSGQVSIRALRKVSVEDLLGRDPVELDRESIVREISGRSILITGGGGSIGAELCRQIAQFGPGALIVADNSEFNLYTILAEFRQPQNLHLNFHAILVDVCDPIAVRRLFERYRPDLVFHAAAYKQVPMLENQEREAVRVNVFGTENVARSAIQYGADGFGLISTDKAVHPANAMGVSKRVAEMLCQYLYAESPSVRFITVRFGNVLDSAGSVVPLFRQQIADGGPVTVTHPQIKRYFMTIPEACQLIMEACAIGDGGEVFVLDMGEPITIDYLARQMIQLSGLRPDDDIQIRYVGLRPGEKMTEELLYEEEITQTRHDKLLLAAPRHLNTATFARDIASLREACDHFDEAALRAQLSSIVPDFRPLPEAMLSDQHRVDGASGIKQ